MNAAIQDILRDVEHLLEVHRNPGLKRQLMMRIEIACEALRGQAKDPDLGPWEVLPDGASIMSDNFDHDVMLKVSGDFYGDEARLAYSKRLAQQLNGLPKEPPPALLCSMATRLRHDFGIDADDSSPMSSGFTEREREVMLADMRKLYEEVSGHGFYKWE